MPTDDELKTKAELQADVETLRRRVAELERLLGQRQQVIDALYASETGNICM